MEIDKDKEPVDQPGPRTVTLDRLRPNNWYVNRVKLERILAVWARGEQATLPPVLVTRIDGELSLIDGHARALGALESGAEEIAAEFQPVDEIEGSTALYVHIHRQGPARGVRRLSDLRARVVDPLDHERLWIGYCENWLRENQAEDGGGPGG